MTIIVNDTEITLPSSKSEFTLGQRIAFEQEHGNLLSKMWKSILEMEDENDRKIEMVTFHFEKMFRVFSFFTAIDLDVVRESDFVDQIADIYYNQLAALVDNDHPKELKRQFSFNDEIWILPEIELKHGDKLGFGEVIDSKQRVKDMEEVEMSRAEQLLPISAIYLRRQGEDYQEEFLYEGSERLNVMQKLPMDIADHVGFFLTSLMITCFRISTYLKSLRQRLTGSISSITLIGGAGSTS
jgi:hypothetical protein